jgi:hypothetical protein
MGQGYRIPVPPEAPAHPGPARIKRGRLPVDSNGTVEAERPRKSSRRTPLAFPPRREEVRARYSVRALVEPRITASGISEGQAGARRKLPWSQVLRAVAAEVGEPQGVRTVVFDLVVGRSEDAYSLVRFDAEPGEASEEAARALARALTPEQLDGSIRSLASEGGPAQWHPDLESFEEASLLALLVAGQ